MHPDLDLPTAELFDKICDEFEDHWDGAAIYRIDDVIEEVGERYRVALATELVRVDIELRQSNALKVDARMYAKWLKDPEQLIEEFKAIQRATASQRFDGLSELSDVADLPKPPRLPGLNVIGLVGRGVLGTVWAGIDDSLARQTYAVKVIRLNGPEAGLQNPFIKSIRRCVGLRHPNVASIIGAGKLTDVGGGPAEEATENRADHEADLQNSSDVYFVSELVSGTAFHEYCQNFRLGWEVRVRLLLQVCEAVSFAHSMDVTHLGLNPMNILVCATSETRNISITDYGVGEVLGRLRVERILAEASESEHFLLAADCLAPEQIAGEKAITFRSDIYALGVMLENCLVPDEFANVCALRKQNLSITDALNRRHDLNCRSALRSFNAASPSAQVRIAQQVGGTDLQSYRGELLPRIDPVVEKATQRDPAKRYSSVEELIADLGVVLQTDDRKTSKANVGRYRIAAPRPVIFLLFCIIGLILAVRFLPGGSDGFNSERTRRIESSSTPNVDGLFKTAIRPLLISDNVVPDQWSSMSAKESIDRVRRSLQSIPYDCVVVQSMEKLVEDRLEKKSLEWTLPGSERRFAILENTAKQLRELKGQMDWETLREAHFALGLAWMEIGNWAEAEVVFMSLLNGESATKDRVNVWALRVKTQLGLVDLLDGRREKCKSKLREVISRSWATQESQSNFYCLAHYGLGEYYLRIQEFDEAENRFRKAGEASYQRNGSDSHGRVHSAAKVGECLIEEKRFKEAKTHLAQLLPSSKRSFGSEATLTKYIGLLFESAQRSSK